MFCGVRLEGRERGWRKVCVCVCVYASVDFDLVGNPSVTANRERELEKIKTHLNHLGRCTRRGEGRWKMKEGESSWRLLALPDLRYIVHERCVVGTKTQAEYQILKGEAQLMFQLKKK